MRKILKVGVVGVGGIAKTHMLGWAASEHAEVIAGSDVDTAVLNAWGQTHGVSRLSTGCEELFSNPDIDVVDICTTNIRHTPLVVAALNAGKHVIYEKPLAPTPQGIWQMIEARDPSGRLLMTA